LGHAASAPSTHPASSSKNEQHRTDGDSASSHSDLSHSTRSFSSCGSSTKQADGKVPEDVHNFMMSRLDSLHVGASRRQQPVLEVCLQTMTWEEIWAEREELEGVLDAAGLWSAGAVHHATGKCRPCHYIHSRSGCENGKTCEYCHFPHTGKMRRSVGMFSRIYCKNFADVIQEAYKDDPARLERVVQFAASASSYLAALCCDRRGSEGSTCSAASAESHSQESGEWSGSIEEILETGVHTVGSVEPKKERIIKNKNIVAL